jgi:hypothetical protein
MKIKEIKYKEESIGIWQVTFSPNWLEKLFNPLFKEYTEEFKSTGDTYTFGGGNVYRRKDGSELSNGNWIAEAIDRHRRKW